MGSVSPLGLGLDQARSSYQRGLPCLSSENPIVGRISQSGEGALADLVAECRHYRDLDRSVRLALLAARQLGGLSGRVSVCVGSSRGATGLWETAHRQFLQHGRVGVRTSPTTTLGNLSSWVAQDQSLQGLNIDQSVTCSTALHAVIQAISWVEAGLATRVIAGASEAPLTPFTQAQMDALRIYAKPGTHRFPCEPLNGSRNSFVLSEGANAFLLSKTPQSGALASIRGIGFAQETIQHPVAISGASLDQAMRRALNDAEMDAREVDAIALHAPGTLVGDEAELRAVKDVFGEPVPTLLSHKWIMGHALGASGGFNLELAVLALQTGSVPYDSFQFEVAQRHRPIRRALVNATGFGGNCVSLVVESMRH